jgi:outer membrane murein-binding lipoprotein Lpp
VKRAVFLFLSAVTVLAVLWVGGCASESAQTQALYTDAKKMLDEIDRAFTLPSSTERAALMNKIISEKWDIQVVDKLRQYLKEAPKGKYITAATDLLDKAMKSDRLRNLGLVRPILEKQSQGIPKTQTEADSITARLSRQQQAKPDSVAQSTPGGK